MLPPDHFLSYKLACHLSSKFKDYKAQCAWIYHGRIAYTVSLPARVRNATLQSCASHASQISSDDFLVSQQDRQVSHPRHIPELPNLILGIGLIEACRALQHIPNYLPSYKAYLGFKVSVYYILAI